MIVLHDLDSKQGQIEEHLEFADTALENKT